MAHPSRRPWPRRLPVLTVVLAAGTTVALLMPQASGQGDAGDPPALDLTTPVVDTSTPAIGASSVAGATTIASAAGPATLPAVSAQAPAAAPTLQAAGDLTGPAPIQAGGVAGATTIPGPPVIDPALAVIVTEAPRPASRRLG